MASGNYISKVAIVGAGGNSGKFMAEALLKTGKHTVTAITRVDSQSQLPEGVEVKKVDYGKTETLIDALKGQDALVITMNVFAKDAQAPLIDAAVEAGVPWILPNEWSPDTANEALVKDVFSFQPQGAIRKHIASLGKSSYIAVSTGFWYEWSMAFAAGFGFDFKNKAVTLFDDGDTKISTSTWPQVGRAVAALLSLPIKSENGSEKTACLDDLRDKQVYVNSFTISQNDMFESVVRVTGTSKDDWTVTKENSKERYMSGAKEMKEGNRMGFAKMMYTRVFYPDGCGDFEHGRGTLNKILGLPKEDIDKATEVAIERSKTNAWGS